MSSTENEAEKVGYKRPPRHSQFKKGQSGNPGGRRRMQQGSFRDDLEHSLGMKVHGEECTIRQHVVSKVILSAFAGNLRAIQLLMREFD